MSRRSRIIRLPNPRKQHVISEMHLRRFADGDGNLFVYEKDRDIRKSVPGREAVQRDYFECKIPGYETNFEFEKRLANLEAKASPAYSKLIENIELSYEEELAWAGYLASTFLRSRKVREELSEENYKRLRESSRDYLHLRELQYKLLQQTGRIVPLEDIQESNEKALALFADPAYRQINSINFSTPNLATALFGKRWQVVSPAAGMQFVTSDAPAISFAFEGAKSRVGLGWGREEVHVGMPLDPTHFFIASPKTVVWNPILDVETTSAFIGTMAQFSYRNIYSQLRNPDVKDALERHGGTLVFGRDAFMVPAA